MDMTSQHHAATFYALAMDLDGLIDLWFTHSGAWDCAIYSYDYNLSVYADRMPLQPVPVGVMHIKRRKAYTRARALWT